MPARTIWELNAPASPRSPATRSSPTLSRLSCSSRIGNLGTPPAAFAASRVIRLIASAYGRSASIRCSARRRRAAATISIARVIFWMFLTASMRLRTSRWVAIGLGVSEARPRSGGHGLLALLGSAVARLLGAAVAVAVRIALGAPFRNLVEVALLERMALLIEVVAEVLGELLDRRVDGLLGLVGPVAAGDRLQHLGLVPAHVAGQACQEPVDLVDDDPVEEAVRGRVDLHDLVLGRHR